VSKLSGGRELAGVVVVEAEVDVALGFLDNCVLFQ
jgi:hypothetical protein